jgi:hypothetical protein
MKNSFESKIEDIILNESILNNFKILDNARKIRNVRVQNLTNDILNGIGIKNAVHVNNKNGLLRIIDGNHRIMACKNLLTENPKTQIKIRLQIYNNLSENEEKELYVILQSATQQTFNDFIQLFQNDIPILVKINQNFPVDVNIYSRKEAILTTHLLKAYINAKESSIRIRGKQDLFDLAKKLNEDDYCELKSFFQNYIQCFGKPEQLSPYYKSSTLWLLMSLYFRNKGVMELSAFWQRLKRKLYNSKEILDLTQTNSFEYAAEQRRRILEKLNCGWQGTPFI